MGAVECLMSRSNHTLLDNEVPKIEIIVFAVQFIVGYQIQLLSYFTTQMLPVALYLAGRHKRPEYLLNSQNVLIIPHWLLKGYR
jgi:hypothetical protein